MQSNAISLLWSDFEALRMVPLFLSRRVEHGVVFYVFEQESTGVFTCEVLGDLPCASPSFP